MIRIEVVAGIALLFLVTMGLGTCAADRADKKAAALAQESARLKGQAEGWYTLYVEHQAKVDTQVVVQRQTDVRVERILVEVRGEPVPEGCEEVVEKHRMALDTLEVSRNGWQRTFEEQQAATARLRGSYAKLDTAHVRLQEAYQRALYPPRRLQIDFPVVSAGLCTTGQPCALVGATLRYGR